MRRALATLDAGVHWVETKVIAASMAVMSLTVFMDVLHRRLADPRSKLAEWIGAAAGVADGSATAATLNDTVAPALSWLITFGLARWVAGSVRRAVVVCVALGCFAELVVRAPSFVVYGVIMAALIGAFLWHVAGWADGVARVKAGLVVGLVAVVGGWGLANMPQGYSWAQNFSLFLLLWVGFLGASVATRTRRHIQVDAFRKYVPERWLALYNAASVAVSGAFAAFLMYVAWLYTFGPEGNIHFEPDIGRVPDWLVTASMPVAFLIIALRMAAQVVQELSAARSGAPSPMGRHEEGAH